MDGRRICIIDNGSCYTKAGFAGDESPRSVFPTVLGRPKDTQATGGPKKDYYIGDDAYAKAAALYLNYPIDHGIIQNWNNMEKIWHYTFDTELRVDSSEVPVFIADSIINNSKVKEGT